MNMYSPIQKIDDETNHLYIKRDDLLPFSFGGNKYRIAKEFIADMKLKGKNCMIGYGNARSNLSRALANLCASENIECHIISPSDDDGQTRFSFNENLCKICDAIFHKCKKNEVAPTIEKVIKLCKAKNFNPYYINGDIYGKGNEITPVKAYYNAYKEIEAYEIENGVAFDYIFLPLGTGMTTSGLVCACSERRRKTKIVGISIARDFERASQSLKNYIDAFALHSKNTECNNFIVEDSYLCGGYGKSLPEEIQLIESVFRKTGIPFDITYSGKAFYGMKKYLDKHNIQKKNILFLHTGGTPLFFDYLKNKKNKVNVIQCHNTDKLRVFLEKVDKTLPVPLSSRVDLDSYAKKVITNGSVLAVESDSEICAASLFYCNNEINRTAYITLLATDPNYKRNGFAETLLDETEAFCKKRGMNVVELDTEKTNTIAISLYSKNGYIIDSVSPKVHMKKRLFCP